PLLALTAADLMTRDVVTIPAGSPVRAAVARLREHSLEFAPVVDPLGRCTATLDAGDLLGCGLDDSEATASRLDESPPTCPYRVEGTLLTGERGALCTAAPGACPYQLAQPSTGGRHVLMCERPAGVLGSWSKVAADAAQVGVNRYSKSEFASVRPSAPLSELMRMMVDGYQHRLVVLDDEGKPVGVVSSLDVLGALGASRPRAHRFRNPR
ncbi:MAG TPA: CBS domain-containing protein, partial [Pirellulales bacterium]